MNYLVRIFMGEHHTEFYCDEDMVKQWRQAGKILARAETNEDLVTRFFESGGFIMKHPKSTEYISPTSITKIDIIQTDKE